MFGGQIMAIDCCCMCKSNAKLVDRHQLHCETASSMWNDYFSWIVLAWVMPRRDVYLFYFWRVIWQPANLNCVENGSYLPQLVYLEGKEWQNLSGAGKNVGGAKKVLLSILFNLRLLLCNIISWHPHHQDYRATGIAQRTLIIDSLGS